MPQVPDQWLPSFLFEPRSALQQLADLFAYPQLLLELREEEEEEEENAGGDRRLIKVLAWFISGFLVRPKAAKRPHSPREAEHFAVEWEKIPATWNSAQLIKRDPQDDEPAGKHEERNLSAPGIEQNLEDRDSVDSLAKEEAAEQPTRNSEDYWRKNFTSARFVAEQVEENATAIWFESQRICAEGLLKSAKCSWAFNSIAWRYEGKIRLRVKVTQEEEEVYEITLPTRYLRGILFGPLSMELGGKCRILCEKTGLEACIRFNLAPFFTGSSEKNSISAKIFQIGPKRKTLYTLKGSWSEKVYIKDLRTGAEKTFLQADQLEMPMKVLKSISDVDERDSRKVWKHVNKALKRLDYSVATLERAKLASKSLRVVNDSALVQKGRSDDRFPLYFVKSSGGDYQIKQKTLFL